MTANQNAAQEYLKRIREVEISINNKELELEALRYKASGAGAIRYDKDKVQASPQDYMTMAIADIIELEQQIEEDKASVEELKGSAYSLVRKIDKPEQRAFIEWYYLNGVSMEQCIQNLYMSERSVYYLKDDALEEFGKLLAN